MEPHRDETTQIVPSAPNYDDTLRRKDNIYENGNSYTDNFNTFARNTLRKKRRRQGNTVSDVFNNPASSNDLASFLQSNFPNQSFSSNLNIQPPPAYSLTDLPLQTSKSEVKLSEHIKIPPNPPEPESTLFLVDTSSASKPMLNQVKIALSNIKFYKQTSPHLITFSDDIVAWRKHGQLLVSGEQLLSINEIEQISKENPHSTDTRTFLSDVENLNSSGKSCLYSAILFAVNYSSQIKTSFSKIIILNSDSKKKIIGLNSDILEHVSIIARFYGIQINVVQLKPTSSEYFFGKICNESGGKLITCPEDMVKKITELYEAPLSNLKQTCVKVCAKNGSQSEFYPGNLATRSDVLNIEVFSGRNVVFVDGKIEGDKEFKVSFELNSVRS